MNYGHGASKFNDGKNLVLPLGRPKNRLVISSPKK